MTHSMVLYPEYNTPRWAYHHICLLFFTYCRHTILWSAPFSFFSVYQGLTTLKHQPSRFWARDMSGASTGSRLHPSPEASLAWSGGRTGMPEQMLARNSTELQKTGIFKKEENLDGAEITWDYCYVTFSATSGFRHPTSGMQIWPLHISIPVQPSPP